MQVEPKLVMAVKSIVSQALPPLLAHSLEPLPKCLPSVTEEFARQTSNLGLKDCSACVAKAAAQPAGTSRPLAMFFPFDPYLLLRSRAYLRLPDTYVLWRSGHPAGASPSHAHDGAPSPFHLFTPVEVPIRANGASLIPAGMRSCRHCFSN